MAFFLLFVEPFLIGGDGFEVLIVVVIWDEQTLAGRIVGKRLDEVLEVGVGVRELRVDFLNLFVILLVIRV